MYVIDLEGTQYPIQTTVKQDYELNGNQSLETLIKSNKVNDKFIKDISQMWSIVDFDGVEYKIIYFKRKGEGTKMTVDILSIPLFFHAFNKDRIYDEYNEHMTAQVAFRRIFEGTRYDFVIHGTFKAVGWEGFGAGEPRLATFKRALERYKAEFEIKGNTIHLKNLVGRDTQFQYRHRLNASDITQEVDAEGMWTYARGYGDYGDGDGGEDWKDADLEREYTSPLAKIPGIGKLHGPPIKNGKITDFETLDKNLKTLVDESVEVSVSASLHDLRKRGYKLAQPENGDRVFLIDERIEFDQEIRVVFMTVIKDWEGNILDLNVTFGGAGLTKRHQANIDTAIKNIEDVMSGNKKLPYNVLDNAILTATEALRSAQTELLFDNGIIAQEKDDPNRLVLLNSKGLGITADGGGAFKEAITADGFVLSAGAVGRLSANHIQIGPETEYGDNYDPSTKETPEQAQAKIDAMKEKVDEEIGEVISDLDEFDDYIEHAFKDGVIEEAEAKAIEKYINTLRAEKDTLTSQIEMLTSNEHLGPLYHLIFEGVFDTDYTKSYNKLIQSINSAIADGKTTATEKTDVDTKFADYREKVKMVIKAIGMAIDDITKNRVDEADTEMRDNLNITAPLPTSIGLGSDGITASTSTPGKYARLDYRGLYIRGGAIQIDGGLPDKQIEGSGKWDRQGTYINQYGIYTGTVTANQVSVGFNNVANSVKITSSGLETYSGINRTSLLNQHGHRFYRNEKHIGNIGTSNWVDDTSYRGLTFQMADEASYMAWSHLDGSGSAIVQMAWHKDGSYDKFKGFTFRDDVTLLKDFKLGYDQQAGLGVFNNAIRLEFGPKNRITLFDSGQIQFTAGGKSKHTFYPDGTKSGGSIEVDNENLGMSPLDSPQVLIEYIEFDVEISPYGTKVLLDETYLKTVTSFATFPNNGEIIEKGINFIIIKGDGLADIRFVGKRIEHEDAFWGNMTEKEEVIEVEPTRELVTSTDS